MKVRFTVAAVAVAALTLTACSGQTKPPAQTSSSSTSAPTSLAVTSSETKAAPATAPAMGDKPNRDFLIGKWGTNGDCALAIDLRVDGTSDGPFGNWAYSNGVISFPDEPDFKVSVTVIDNKTMAADNGEGKTSKMTRCP